MYSLATFFSGAGGLDCGFLESGSFTGVLANDVLEPPARTYVKNFSHRIIPVEEFKQNPLHPVYLLGDIKNLDSSSLGHIDCIIGGPPCQDFSIVRGVSPQRRGIDVTRGRLYLHFVGAISKARPKVFVFENVPGLLSANGGLAYKTILSDLSNVNVVNRRKNLKNNPTEYRLIYSKILDTVNVGVPQRRQRLIIVGVRADLVNSLLENKLRQKAESILEGQRSLLRKYPLTTLETMTGQPLTKLESEYAEIMQEYEGVAEKVGTPNAIKWNERVWKNLTFDSMKDYFWLNRITPKDGDEVARAMLEHERVLRELGYLGTNVQDRLFPDKSNELPKESERVQMRMQLIPPDMNYQFVSGTKWSVKGRMSNIYRRIHPLKPAYTVIAYGGGGTWTYHYRRNRGRVTNRERARLQTFPDSFIFDGNVSEVRAQIGEAVPTHLGRKIASLVQIVLEEIYYSII